MLKEKKKWKHVLIWNDIEWHWWKTGTSWDLNSAQECDEAREIRAAVMRWKVVPDGLSCSRNVVVDGMRLSRAKTESLTGRGTAAVGPVVWENIFSRNSPCTPHSWRKISNMLVKNMYKIWNDMVKKYEICFMYHICESWKTSTSVNFLNVWKLERT